MIKWILAPNYIVGERFIEILWRKDKDISNYKHLNRLEDALGRNFGEDQLIRLKGWETKQDAQEILDYVISGGITILSSRNNPRRERIPPLELETDSSIGIVPLRPTYNETVSGRALSLGTLNIVMEELRTQPPPPINSEPRWLIGEQPGWLIDEQPRWLNDRI